MRIVEIKVQGKKSKGKKELVDHLSGKKLNARQAILARCYDCMGMYVDGKKDCGLKGCSLYPFMPYRDGDKLILRKMSDEQKKNIGTPRRKK